ncbi:hypothetical protein PoB_004956000 [Plakobranchus ocellatus]|uniref:Uncharacterized protein n=1 Tax=Plakobranchus ocellatus TaxID=259542 RepID=A0AAV4BVC4_9GAST|nr:hypothetical protein PoB_004956000 [Plakobranchus ocellatus]
MREQKPVIILKTQPASVVASDFALEQNASFCHGFKSATDAQLGKSQNTLRGSRNGRYDWQKTIRRYGDLPGPLCIKHCYWLID